MVACRPQFTVHLFSATLVKDLEILANSLRCVLRGFPSFANLGEIIVIILAHHTNGPSHHIRPYLLPPYHSSLSYLNELTNER
jgi:hypothetical protein